MPTCIVLVIALTHALFAGANPESDRVHSLPGWPLDLPSRMYTISPASFPRLVHVRRAAQVLRLPRRRPRPWRPPRKHEYALRLHRERAQPFKRPSNCLVRSMLSSAAALLVENCTFSGTMVAPAHPPFLVFMLSSALCFSTILAWPTPSTTPLAFPS
jgi:hypothetical protein